MCQNPPAGGDLTRLWELRLRVWSPSVQAATRSRALAARQHEQHHPRPTARARAAARRRSTTEPARGRLHPRLPRRLLRRHAPDHPAREGRGRRPRLWRRRRAQPRLGHGAVGVREALADHLRGNRHSEIAGRKGSPSTDRARSTAVTSPATGHPRHHPGADPVRLRARISADAASTRAVNDALQSNYLTRSQLAEFLDAPPPRASASSRSSPPPTAPPAPSSRTPSSPSASATACRAPRSTRSSPATRWTRTSRPNG